MDRREFAKELGVGAVCSIGLPLAVTGVVHSAIKRGMEIQARNPPYDPIAVLEAMRDGEHEVQIMFSPRAVGRVYVHYNPSRDAIGVLGPPRAFPDFLSAVQWLHRQAAAADPEFAEKFPLPTE